MIHPRYFLLQAQPFSLSISTNIIFILFHFRSYFSPIIPGKIIVDYPYSGLLLVPSYFQSEKSSKYFIFSGHLFFGSIKTHLSSAPKPLQVFSYGPWDIFLFLWSASIIQCFCYICLLGNRVRILVTSVNCRGSYLPPVGGISVHRTLTKRVSTSYIHLSILGSKILH